jgi:hypothetical protein
MAYEGTIRGKESAGRARSSSLVSIRARRIFRENGLSIVLTVMFLGTLVPMSVAGWHSGNEERRGHGAAPVGYPEYLVSDHFWEAMMENWESEFLQMAFYVILTVFLFQKGSAESKDPEEPEEVDRQPSRKRKDAPWPVAAGGLVLKLYQNSLSLAFLFLFAVSFALHASSGASEYSQDQLQHGGTTVSTLQYVGTSRFWFESFQNWQSEFLAILAMVVLSIHLRQKGSPESKPVDSPHCQTGV